MNFSLLRLRQILGLIAGVAMGVSGVQAAETLTLNAREQQRSSGSTNSWETVQQALTWPARKTAIIICDMWDRHWCAGASARVAEMAPRMNDVLKAARRRGVLVIHAPSDTLQFYADTPQRRRAQEAPKATPSADASRWKSLDRAKEGPLPIDDADGGCDDSPQCPQGHPWKRQIALLDIEPEDVITDRGEEVYNLLAQLGIEHVIVLGVHTNMCVLGRSFAIRSLVGMGKHVVLMRDLTDTMYNSRQRPWVSHFAGTDLVIAHIERYWCPTVTSADFLGGAPFHFQADHRPRIAFVIGENEYRTWETLPQFATQTLTWRGFTPVFVASTPRTDDYHFQNAEALRDADLIVVSARRRALPAAMLADLRRHLDTGKPLVGIRTASHAFAVREGSLTTGSEGPPLVQWPDFDATVLGGNYRGHHPSGPTTTVRVADGAQDHPVLTGLRATELASKATLYRTGPLRTGTQALLIGAIPGQSEEPLAWTHAYGPKAAPVFYTSLGHVEDFANPAFRRLLLNAISWGLQRPPPPAEAALDPP